ncbi:MAG: methyltransferase domain-containing protein [Chloroflexi bacterium]|nr:methyltransferase domain-containing protein [Chloroflexota bacterium]
MALDLPADSFRRYDESPDPWFYTQPRFVEHIDDGAIAAVTQLYRELFPAGGRILDLMSSWVSHLPAEVDYRQVVGVGLNEEELAANPRLDAYLVQDLNASPSLPFEDHSFDAAGICVSIQYLTHPVEVLRELGRVLRPGAPLAVTFSNRCFPTKAVAIWQSLDDAGHAELVTRYLQAARNWSDIRALDRTPPAFGSDPLFAIVGLRSASEARATV